MKLLKTTVVAVALMASASASATSLPIGLIGAIGGLFVPPAPPAAPKYWHGDGTYSTYDLIDTGSSISWTAAKSAAEAKGGYLATFTTQSENDFVFNDLTSRFTDDAWSNWNRSGQHLYGPWFGLYQVDPTSGRIDPSANWKWLNGEGDLTYRNWARYEPNDDGGAGSESYAHFWDFTSPHGTPKNEWNDTTESAENKISSYIIEYRTLAPVPVPAAAFLFAPALAGFVALRRKAKKA
jgi:hypothetical protein